MATKPAAAGRLTTLAALASLLLAGPVCAAGGPPPFSFKADTANKASLQRGARTFMNYCSSCHSLKYLRYNRLGRDLDIPEEMLRANLMFTSDKTGDVIRTAMPPDAEAWFGRVPPDLTLTARERGGDWLFSYLLTFYVDPTKPAGVNNLMLPGVSMPHVLGDLQGYNVLDTSQEEEHHGHRRPKLVQAQAGSLSPAEYKELVGDLTNFMVYAAEPGRNHRIGVGIAVMGFLVVFWILAYLLKREYWKDVH